ncbi:MAG TPA: flagellar protein FlaG [Clostridia bacterium]|nr:flagellar protein FlaG [Clostridia bacterium]
MDSKEVLRVRNTRFEFSVHEGTEKIMVKVIDEGTDEIIREIPPEQILNMVAKMWELAGLLVDKRA